MPLASELAMESALESARQARSRIQGITLRTPLIRLNCDSPNEIFLKLESLQPIGSFKIRGAANAMLQLPAERARRGFLTASAGNMAQGVAYMARRMGVPATVITPDSAPETKIRAVERLGGRVIQVPFDQWWQTFETRAFPGVDATFVHAFDDPQVRAGNGTIGFELLEDQPDLDAIVIPWGGGGLACGIAAVAKALKPSIRVYAVESETGPPLSASLAAGHPVVVDYRPSFIDGIASRTVFPNMLDLARRLIDGVIVLRLEEAAAAIRLVAERARVLIEGAAACAVAGALKITVKSGIDPSVPAGNAGHPTTGPAADGTGCPVFHHPQKIAAIVSGGNINLEKFCELCR